MGFSAEQERRTSALEATSNSSRTVANTQAEHCFDLLKPDEEQDSALGRLSLLHGAVSTTEVDPGVKALYEAELHRICRISPPASRELPLRPNAALLLEGPSSQPSAARVQPAHLKP